MYYYTAYSLGFQSELVLPELVTSNVNPDVTVRLDEVGPAAHNKMSQSHLLTAETEVGKFFIVDRNEIVVKPNPGVEEAQLRLFLLGPVLAVLLRRRGLLVLHASAVAVKGAVVAFLGEAGWGKSTLSGAFQAEGYPLVTDDVLAIETASGQPVALPGIPQAKFWPDAAVALNCRPEKLSELYPQSVKLGYRLSNGSFVEKPLPLKAIYLLGEVSPQPAVVPCTSQQAFLNLLRHSRAKYIPNSPTLDCLRFQQCTQLVKQVPIRLLKRQRSLEALPDLVSLIEQDLASHER